MSLPGTYEVRYLPNNGFTLAATSNAVGVVAQPGSFGISATPTQVVPGREVYGYWTASSGSTPADEVGLFSTAQPPTIAIATQTTGGAANGCAAFAVPTSGTYEVRYLYAGSLDVAAAALTTIASPGSYNLTASPDPAASGSLRGAALHRSSKHGAEDPGTGLPRTGPRRAS